MPSIFLSYARDDDEPFVKRLYDDLVAHGFEVWWDRVSMPSRQLTFHQEIRDAIMARDRIALVIGPHAVTSDYVNQEWQWALEMGKCINPIIRLNGRQQGGGLIDGYALLPEQLKLVHAEDFRDNSLYKEHLENLVRPLSAGGKFLAGMYHYRTMKRINFQRTRCPECLHVMRYAHSTDRWNCTFCPCELSNEELTNYKPDPEPTIEDSPLLAMFRKQPDTAPATSQANVYDMRSEK